MLGYLAIILFLQQVKIQKSSFLAKEIMISSNTFPVIEFFSILYQFYTEQQLLQFRETVVPQFSQLPNIILVQF